MGYFTMLWPVAAMWTTMLWTYVPQDMDNFEGNDIFMCEYMYDEPFKV